MKSQLKISKSSLNTCTAIPQIKEVTSSQDAGSSLCLSVLCFSGLVLSSRGSTVRVTQPHFFYASALSASSAPTHSPSLFRSLSFLSHFYLPFPTSSLPFLPSLSSSHTHLMRQRLSNCQLVSMQERCPFWGDHTIIKPTVVLDGIFISCKLDRGNT